MLDPRVTVLVQTSTVVLARDPQAISDRVKVGIDVCIAVHGHQGIRILAGHG